MSETYPVLCWPISDDLVCGVVVADRYSGEPYLQAVRASRNKVIAALGEELRREEIAIEAPMLRPRHRRVAIEVTPSWQEGARSFPFKDPVQVQVDAVWGETASGAFECILPRLGVGFTFESASRLPALVEYFARSAIRRMDPTDLFRHLMAPEASLERVIAKRKRRRRGVKPEGPNLKRLPKVADKLPKKVLQSREPDAAWNRAESVKAIRPWLGKTHVLVVGEPGVGKSAVIRQAVGLAAVNRSLDVSFWRTSAHRLVAGARYLGDWQRNVDEVIEDARAVKATLWISDLTELVHVGGSGPQDSIAAFLLPAMDAGHVHLVGETTPRGLHALRALLPAFVERFRVVRLDALTAPDARDVSARYADWLAERALPVDDDALKLAHGLLDRHVRSRQFPGKAVRFLAEAMQRAEESAWERVDVDIVMDTFVSRTGLPRSLVDDAITVDIDALRESMGERIIGQREAIASVCEVIARFKTGLHDPDKPLATLLFSGPTGVGKTALAKVVADRFFGGAGEVPLIRLDMSEFQHPHQLDRLIGSSGGEPGELVRKLRARPFSVVLFDEVEKASAVFFDTLLGVLDEGILVDAMGRVTDFRSTVIIMTSNLGSGARGRTGFTRNDTEDRLGDIKRFFRPEFFNRIDRIVPFHALTEDEVRAIARLELGRLDAREGMTTRGITLSFDDALVQHVVRLGYDPSYGARALQRVVESQVVAVISRFLLSQPRLRDARLRVGVQDGLVRVQPLLSPP